MGRTYDELTMRDVAPRVLLVLMMAAALTVCPAARALSPPALAPPEVVLATGKQIRVVTADDGGIVIERIGRNERTHFPPVRFAYASGENLPKPEQTRRTDPTHFGPRSAVVSSAAGLGSEEAYVGWGGSDYSTKAATPQIIRYARRARGRWESELIWQAPPTIRPDITSLTAGDITGDRRPEIVFSFFRSKFVSGGGYITWRKPADREPRVVELHDAHMGLLRIVADLDGTGNGDVFVGKVYAVPMQNPDDTWPKDVFLYRDPLTGGGAGRFLEADPAAERLPTVNGVRGAMAKADLDGDGRDELYVADGWHSDYGRMARARLTQVTRGRDGRYRAELVEEIDAPEVPNVERIEIRDVDGDRKQEVVAAVPWPADEEPAGVRWFAYRRSKKGWLVSPLNAEGKTTTWTATRQPGGPVPTEPDHVVGKPTPPITAEHWIGDKPELKGKVLLLDFWATWCVPCIKEFPHMQDLQKKFGERGLQVVGFTEADATQSVAKVREFLQKTPLTYPVAVSIGKRVSRSYGVRALPTVFLIDRKGVIRHAFQGGGKSAEIEKAVTELLSERD